MAEMNQLEEKLRTQIDDVYFRPQEDFKPLMHVMEVLAAEIKEVEQVTPEPSTSPVLAHRDSGYRRRGSSTNIPDEVSEDKSGRRGSTVFASAPPPAPPDPPAIYLSVRTLAGKVLPVPGVGPADSICDVFRSLEQHYNVRCGDSVGNAGLYFQGTQLTDPLLPLRELPFPTKGATLMLQNHAYKTLQKQMQCVDSVVEGFLNAHYNTLSSSVHAIGEVSRQFYGLKERVAGLRRQVGDTKQLLTVGMREQPIRELWERNREYTYMLEMLDTLKTIRDAPAVIDSLLERNCFVAAVSQFNTAKDLMFAEEMVPIPALAGVRDQIHGRKSRLLDIIAEGFQDLLFAVPIEELLSPHFHENSFQNNRSTMNENDESGDRLTSLLGSGYTTAQVIALEASINDRLKSQSSSSTTTTSSSSSGGSVSLGSLKSTDVALRLQLLLEASHSMQSLGDIQSYVMERTKEGLFRLGQSVKTLVQSKFFLQHSSNRSKQLFIRNEGNLSSSSVANEDSNFDPMNSERLIIFLDFLFHCYLSVIDRYLKLCELVHVTKNGEGRFGGNGGVNWMPVEHLWGEMQKHLRELLTSFLTDDVLASSSPSENNNPSSSSSASLDHSQNDQFHPTQSQKIIRRNGGKAYFSFRGTDKSGRRGMSPRLLGEMPGLTTASFSVTSTSSQPINPIEGNVIGMSPDKSGKAEGTMNLAGGGGGGGGASVDFALCEPDPMHACDVALPLHQFVDAARTAMAHFLPLVVADTALEKAQNFLEDPTAPPPDVDYWLRVVITESVLPLMREDATEALDAVLSDRDAFKPSQSFAAATAAAAAAEATASMSSTLKSTDGSGKKQGISRSLAHMNGGNVAAAAGATAATAAAEAAVAKAIATATSSIPPPVCCIEGADAILGSLLSQVGCLPFHFAPLCDLVEDISITLIARLKEEGIRLYSASEAAERISRGNSLEEMMKNENCVTAFKSHYVLHQGFNIQSNSSSIPSTTTTTPLNTSIASSGRDQFTGMENESYDWNAFALEDLWELDAKPYPISTDSLITDRRVLTSLAALAHSGQWLSQRMAKRTVQLLGGNNGGNHAVSTGLDVRSRRRAREGGGAGGGIPALMVSSQIYKRLQATHTHFATYAESMLLVLRTDAILSTFLFMHQLPDSFSKFLRSLNTANSAGQHHHHHPNAALKGATSPTDEDGSDALALIRGAGPHHRAVHVMGMSKNSVVDGAVAALEKHLSLLHRAVLSAAPPAAWAVVINPISDLAPRIAMRTLAYFNRSHKTKNTPLSLAPGAEMFENITSINEKGIDHLLRGVIGGLRHALLGVGANQKERLDLTWDEEISRAEHYFSLLGIDGVALDHEMRLNPPVFSREEFLVIWRLTGPLRKAGTDEQFDLEWNDRNRKI